MNDVNYSCRHPIAIGSRAGGNPKALRYFFALRFPVKLGMTAVHVEAYKTTCRINTSMVGTACPDISPGKDPQAMEYLTPTNHCPKKEVS